MQLIILALVFVGSSNGKADYAVGQGAETCWELVKAESSVTEQSPQKALLKSIKASAFEDWFQGYMASKGRSGLLRLSDVTKFCNKNRSVTFVDAIDSMIKTNSDKEGTGDYADRGAQLCPDFSKSLNYAKQKDNAQFERDLKINYSFEVWAQGFLAGKDKAYLADNGKFASFCRTYPHRVFRAAVESVVEDDEIANQTNSEQVEEPSATSNDDDYQTKKSKVMMSAMLLGGIQIVNMLEERQMSGGMPQGESFGMPPMGTNGGTVLSVPKDGWESAPISR